MSRDGKNALGIGVILFLVLFVFGSFCPMERIFGIPCPGCNMFSAIYWLWKGNLSAAWYFHPAVFLLLPYAVAVCAVLFVRNREDILKRRGISCDECAFVMDNACCIPVANALVFPHAPMQVNEHAPFY